MQQLELQTATKITMPRDGSDVIRIVGTKEGVDSARHEIQIISDEQVSWADSFIKGWFLKSKCPSLSRLLSSLVET